MSTAELETLPAETAIDAEGWIYRVDTGEIVGHSGASELFDVQDHESADWVLELRSQLEGEITGLAARKRALVAQLDAQINAATRRLAWWDWRFSPSLIAFARSQLKGKSKTVQFNWGKVAFRSTPGSTQIIDDAAALAFVETWAPDQVKVVKSVGIKAVQAAQEIATQATGETDTPEFIVCSPPGENVTISTGIDVKGTK